MNKTVYTEETTPTGFVIRYLPNSHRYRLDAVPVNGVSGILNKTLPKPGLMYAAVKLEREGKDFQKEWDKRAKEGTETHHIISQFLQHDEVPEDADAYTRAGFNWYFDVGPELLDAERMVASRKYQYAGRFDLLCEIDGKVARVDLKTRGKWSVDKKGNPRPPYPENLLQLSLYDLAAVESGYLGSDVQYVVELGPDGAYKMWESFAKPGDALVVLDHCKMLADLEARPPALVAPSEIQKAMGQAA